MRRNNVILIGMPSSGKSSIGVLVAKELGMGFVDGDILIQEKYEKKLKTLIEENGVDGFLKIEDEVNASIEKENCVIAPGGSVIYGKNAMEHFKEIGTIIYLEYSYKTIEKRVGNLKERGVTLREGQTFKDLFDERKVLYERYADCTIKCDKKGIAQVIDEIKLSLQKVV